MESWNSCFGGGFALYSGCILGKGCLLGRGCLLKSAGSWYWLSKFVQDNFFLRLNQKSGKRNDGFGTCGPEPEIRQHQEFVEKSCGGQLSNHFQPTIVRKSRAGQLFPTQLQEILWKTINSWKTLARPMFSMNFHEKTMENIGQANVFHEFIEFHRFLAGPRRFSGKP